VIEENKERYYQTLEPISQGRHECKHDPWPFINYLLYILKTAYKEFEEVRDCVTKGREDRDGSRCDSPAER